jgi:hypothetical protein
MSYRIPSGYEIVRGSYVSTPDDRIDRWYVQHEDDTIVDRRGPGYATKADALQAIREHLWEREHDNT